jgi:hypothetical protein
MTAFWVRRTAALVAATASLMGAGCGSDAQDKANELRNKATDAAQQVQDQASELRKQIDEGASEGEIRAKLRKMERDALGKGEDARREAKRLRKELEKQLP